MYIGKFLSFLNQSTQNFLPVIHLKNKNEDFSAILEVNKIIGQLCVCINYIRHFYHINLLVLTSDEQQCPILIKYPINIYLKFYIFT